MATIGWIKVGVVADISAFVKGMAKAAKAAQDFAKTMIAPIKANPFEQFKAGTILYAQGLTNAINKSASFKTILGQVSGGLGLISLSFVKMGLSATVAGVRLLAMPFKIVTSALLNIGKFALDTAGFVVRSAFNIGAALVKATASMIAFGAAAAAVAVGGLAYMVRQATAGIAESSKLAARIGMSSESFQKLGYAAKLSGLDQEEMVKSVEKMNERLGEVAMTGEGKAAAALARFGMTAQQLTQLGPEKAFTTILDVLNKIPNPMERSAVAFELFGKSGQGMINLAQQGAGKIKGMGDEASKLGVALNAVDTAKVQEANVGFIKIGEAIQGLINQIAVKLAPYITYVADLFVDWMTEGTRASSFIAQGIGWVTSAVDHLLDGWNILQAAFYGARGLFDQFLSTVLKGLDWLIKKIVELSNSWLGTNYEATEFFKNFSEGMDNAATEDLKTAKEKWLAQAPDIVRKLREEIETKAGERAKLKAGAQEAAIAPTAITQTPAKLGFATGAAELGTTTGYSAVAQAKARLTDSLQMQIAANGKRTAEATTRTAVALEKMANMQGVVDGPQFRAQHAGAT